MATDVIKVSGDFLIDARNGSITLNATNSQSTGTVIIRGNLHVTGNTSQVETTNASLKDNIIVLNGGEVNQYVTAGTSGILISRGSNDSIANAATILFNDDVYWNQTNRGMFEFSVAEQTSAIRVSAIRIATTATSLNFLGTENPTGVLSVSGTSDYESRIVDDDDIPNKKYVDDKLITGSDTAKRLTFGDTTFSIFDNSIPAQDPFFNASDKIVAVLGDTGEVFRLEGNEAQIQGITISGATIEVNSATDLVLQPQSGNSVKIESALKLQDINYVPTAESNVSSLYYSGVEGAGGTGIQYVNATSTDELVSRRRSIAFGIIF